MVAGWGSTSSAATIDTVSAVVARLNVVPTTATATTTLATGSGHGPEGSGDARPAPVTTTAH